VEDAGHLSTTILHRTAEEVPEPTPVEPVIEPVEPVGVEPAPEVAAVAASPRSGRRPAGSIVAIVAGVAVLAFAARSLAAAGPPADAGAPATTATTARTAPVAKAPVAPPSTTATIGPSPACGAAGSTLDVDGDGCADAVAISDGVVAVHGTRFAVGAPGDDVVVGDWDCDGIATPAVLRPSTGEVFVFSTWSGPGADVTVPSVARVSGGQHAVVQAAPAGCAHLAVERDDGTVVEVPL
jgi:hypothetical protein